MQITDLQSGRDLADDLLADHAALDALFTRLLEAVNANARDDIAALWTEFDTKLRAHLEVEEALILPELRLFDRAEADALLAEHDKLRRSLDDFALRVDLHLTRAAAVSDFIERLRAHAAREDRLLYVWAAANLPRTVQATVRERLGHTLRAMSGRVI